MHIFIIGYMLAGKSTCGRLLAEKRGLPFLDLDDEIEKSSGQSITEIFRTKGEKSFRKTEHEILTRICQMSEPHVVACGGGTPCFCGNIEIMHACGRIIYLIAPLPTLVLRATKERKNRPILANLSDTELTVFIARQLKEREKFYLQADEILSESDI